MNASRISTGLVVAVCLACGGGGGSGSSSGSGGSGGGGSGGGGGTGGSSTVALGAALNQRLEQAPVVTTTLLRQNGQPVVGAEVGFDMRTDGAPVFGAAIIALSAPPTDSSGSTAMAIPAGSYQQSISFKEEGGTGPFLAADGVTIPFVISGNAAPTYRADRYTFKILAPVDITDFTISVYRTKASGALDLGAGGPMLDPLSDYTIRGDWKQPVVYRQTFPLQKPGRAASVDLELFPGNYRTVVTATPASGSDQLAVDLSPVFTVDGASKTVEKDITLSNTGRVLQVKLLDEKKNPLAPLSWGPYVLKFSDPVGFPVEGSLGEVATVTTATATSGSVMVDKALSKVAVTVYDGAPSSNVLGTYVFDAGSNEATLQLVDVTGYVRAAAGTIASDAVPVVLAYSKTGLGADYDGRQVATAYSRSSPWAYDVKLLGSPTGMTYVLSVTNIWTHPESQTLTVTVKDQAIADQNLAVSPGGVIAGKLQDEAHNALTDVEVDIYRVLDDGGFRMQGVAFSGREDSGHEGEYTCNVPFGKYFLVVRGAFTTGVEVSASAPEYRKDLTRYSLTGRITKASGSTAAAAVGATVYTGDGHTSTQDRGQFTLDAFEGQNWFCVVPGKDDPTYGYTCQLNVKVDDASVKAANLL